MEAKIMVLYARPWNLVDENTGKSRSGVSVHYLTTDSLVPFSLEDGSEFGYQPCKQSISVEVAASLTSVPGIYNATFEMRASKGQNILAIAGLNFISVINIAPASVPEEVAPAPEAAPASSKSKK